MLTLVWLLFGVSPDVIVQMGSTSKTFLTVLTLVWFLFGVSPNVTKFFDGSCLQSLSDISGMASLWCESLRECSDLIDTKKTSYSTHIGMVSLWYESLCEL